MRRLVATLFAAALLVAGPAHAFELTSIGSFDGAVHISGPPGDATRVLVVQQNGEIRLVKGGVIQSTPYLALNPDEIDESGEEGLLSMAFASPSRFYVFYNETTGTTGSDLVVAAYDVAPDGDTAVAGSRDEILRIPHRVGNNHNGGQLQMGPDGNLWISTGDGGGTSRDSDGNAQNREDLLGKILRVAPRPDGGYDIPAGNPYANGGGRPEIWAEGLRNPWRFSFDRGTGAMIIGDVGENTQEEIDFAAAPTTACGANFGWPWYEGSFELGSGTRPASHHEPLIVRTHGEGWIAIAGGYVMRDPALGGDVGKLVYGDYSSDKLRLYDFTTGADSESDADVGGVRGFGEDGVGRLYVATTGAAVRRFDADGGGVSGGAGPQQWTAPTGCSGPAPPGGGDTPQDPNQPGGPINVEQNGAPVGQSSRRLRVFVATASRQKAARRRVFLRVWCNQACRFETTGRLFARGASFKLLPTRGGLPSQRTRTLLMQLGRRARRATRRALRRDQTVRVSLRLRASVGEQIARRTLRVTLVE